MKKLTNSEVNLIIDHLFVGQSLPEGFRKKFRAYIQERLDSLGCCALYISQNPELTQHFRKFMNQFELDCGRREVIIHESGSINLLDDYKSAKTNSINQRNPLGILC